MGTGSRKEGAAGRQRADRRVSCRGHRNRRRGRPHQNSNGHYQTRLIRERHVTFADAEALADALATLGVDDFGFTPGILHHANIANPDTVREAGPHGFDDRFLGGEAHGKKARGALGFGQLHLFGGHEEMLDKARAKTLEGLVDALRFENIDTNSKNQSRAATIRAFISRTATLRPSKTAREMMEWPMLSSTISPIAATGCTL